MEIGVYKYWAGQRRRQLRLHWLFVLGRSTDFTVMAPAVIGQASYSTEHLTPAHKLRKPMVEKLRRDRINASIEQLKSLLGPEFLRQQPDSKQEKADILEMAVCYLRSWQQRRRRRQQPAGPPAAADGYARCVREAVGFLSHGRARTQAHERLLGHFQGPRAPGGAGPAAPGSPPRRDKAAAQTGALWRPW
ncbi:transcription factor HES-5-like [Betta splendens]|uniref:Transcription factor HES-5 n=1 Tax=Betta splendens TaxID=158456 RepID=A0A6P7N238_BETSP|nr:transcription factor HES-5-like [Betta splendens]